MKDSQAALLTEIRDLLKEQRDMIAHTEKMRRRGSIAKAVLYALIICLTFAATYFYYYTIVASFGVGLSMIDQKSLMEQS